MLQFDHLQDKRGLFACLINCKYQAGKLYCGFAAFRGGVTDIEVFSGERGFKISAPQNMRQNVTQSGAYDPDDLLFIEVLEEL